MSYLVYVLQLLNFWQSYDPARGGGLQWSQPSGWPISSWDRARAKRMEPWVCGLRWKLSPAKGVERATREFHKQVLLLRDTGWAITSGMLNTCWEENSFSVSQKLVYLVVTAMDTHCSIVCILDMLIVVIRAHVSTGFVTQVERKLQGIKFRLGGEIFVSTHAAVWNICSPPCIPIAIEKLCILDSSRMSHPRISLLWSYSQAELHRRATQPCIGSMPRSLLYLSQYYKQFSVRFSTMRCIS